MALNAKRPWAVAGAAAVVAAGIGVGFTANADEVRLNDVHQAPAATMSSDATGAHDQQQAATEDSPESADSPAASPVDSPGSANTPNDDQDDTPDGDSPDESDQTANTPDDDTPDDED